VIVVKINVGMAKHVNPYKIRHYIKKSLKKQEQQK